MAEIPAAYLAALSDALNALSEDTRALVGAKLSAIVAASGTDNPFELVEEVAEAIEPWLSILCESSASLSATSYDLVRTAAAGEALGAEAYPYHDPDWTRKALYGIAKDHRGNISAFVGEVLNRMDYEARRSAGETTLRNGSRDPLRPRYARVPTGPRTCERCIMYASRGFVYLTEESAGALKKYHPNDDCRIVQGYPGMKVEGYDPEALYRLWQEMEETGANHAVRDASGKLVPVVDDEDERLTDMLTLGHTYLNRSTDLYKYMEKVKPIEGYEDVAIHSDGISFSYRDADDKKETDVSVAEFAEFIRENPNWEKGPIRLLACSAGRYPEGAAQQLADILGVDVLAPNVDINVLRDGTIVLSDDVDAVGDILDGTVEEAGSWVLFRPRAR